MKTTRKISGFTLIELLIVMVILGVLSVVLLPLLSSTMRSYNETQSDIRLLDQLRYATERLAREIREVDYQLASGFNFSNMASDGMAFTRRASDAEGETSLFNVIICSDQNQISLGYANLCSNAYPLTEPVTRLTFDYLDENGNTLVLSPPPLRGVRSVQMTLILTYQGRVFQQRTRVELKNK